MSKMKTTIIITVFGIMLYGSLCDKAVINKSRERRSKIFPIFEAGINILHELSDIWHTLLRNPSLSPQEAIFRNKEHEIIGRITAVNKNVLHLESKINSVYGALVENIVSTLPKTIRAELKLDLLMQIIEEIDIAQNEFKDYLMSIKTNKTFEDMQQTLKHKDLLAYFNSSGEDLENEVKASARNSTVIITKRKATEIEKTTLLTFATWATGPEAGSIKTRLGRLHRILCPKIQIDTGILQLLSDPNTDLGTTVCNLKQSPHQVLYNLYNAVSLADFKGYIMLQFSYMILRLYDKGDFTIESERETKKFEQRTEEKAFAIRNALANAERSKYNCDPKQYVEGLNYVRLTRLLQGYIENEVNLNPYGTCRENCAYYYYTEYHGCFKEQFCSKQEQCRGKVVECKYVDSDMNICKSTDQERRYDWVEYENSHVLGTKGKCQTRNLFKVDSWWRYLFWHCSYCLCLCDNGNHSSDRYFNLRKVTSDVDQNKVITGVRIVKHNSIIHLQIQQGILKPRGVINKSTLSWKPVDNYTIYDKDIENGVDYHTMNWMDRIIDTDEASGPNEHVLTGIRLRKLGNHLNLEIRTTPINFTTGEVYPEGHSLWHGNDNTEVTLSAPRKEIILTNPDIPIRNGPHTIDSQHNHYVKFQATSFESDVGQNTVPYLDAQPVISHGFPLSGFGFIHRGKPGSGGFIAPKLITYNFMPHV